MVSLTQTHCEGCGSVLVPQAAYCTRCHRRTRRARSLVRLAVRMEILFALLIFLMVFAFAAFYYYQ